MKLSCALDGVSPESLGEGVRVEDVICEAPEQALATARRALGGGTLLTSRERTGLRVRVLISVRERSALRRALLLQRLADWSRGTLLTVSTRPGQGLRVSRAALPSAESALDWPRVLTVTFTAMEEPWWRELRPVTASLDSLEQPDGSLPVPGNAGEVPLDATISVLEDGLTSLQLICAGTAIRLEGLTGMAEGDTIAIGHDSAGRLWVKKGETSLLAFRTEDSDDELLAPCGGTAELHLLCDARASAKVKAWGRWE